MRLLFVGDVVGDLGRDMISEYLPQLKQKYKPQVTIVNGENVANGRGITEKDYKGFLKDGADVVTMGNHTFDNRELYEFIPDAKKLIRPANFPDDCTPGMGWVSIKVNALELIVVNLQGRVFLDHLDDPFRKIDQLLAEFNARTPFVFVDFHAETTSEKQAFGWYVDGRVSAVVGTHTHVQTSDARILPEGTAYLTDAGMTGAYDEILGMSKRDSLARFLTQRPTRLEMPREGRTVLSGCVIDLDQQTGLAKKIKPILINADHPFEMEY